MPASRCGEGDIYLIRDLRRIISPEYAGSIDQIAPKSVQNDRDFPAPWTITLDSFVIFRARGPRAVSAFSCQARRQTFL